MAVAMKTGGRIESLLSARLFLNPQLAGDKLYFISDLAGRLSLYRMDVGGSVPEPLLPPGIALQNPELLGGYGFYVLPELDRIVLMLDQDGDENYQPQRDPARRRLPGAAERGSLRRHEDASASTSTRRPATGVRRRRVARGGEAIRRTHRPRDRRSGDSRRRHARPLPRRVDARPLARGARRRLHGRRHRPLRA